MELQSGTRIETRAELARHRREEQADVLGSVEICRQTSVEDAPNWQVPAPRLAQVPIE